MQEKGIEHFHDRQNRDARRQGRQGRGTTGGGLKDVGMWRFGLEHVHAIWPRFFFFLMERDCKRGERCTTCDVRSMESSKGAEDASPQATCKSRR